MKYAARLYLYTRSPPILLLCRMSFLSAPKGDSAPKAEILNSKKPQEIESEIKILSDTNKKMLDDLRKYDEYDRARGVSGGGFRQHHTLCMVEINRNFIVAYTRALDELNTSLNPPRRKSIINKLFGFRRD